MPTCYEMSMTTDLRVPELKFARAPTIRPGLVDLIDKRSQDNRILNRITVVWPDALPTTSHYGISIAGTTFTCFFRQEIAAVPTAKVR